MVPTSSRSSMYYYYYYSVLDVYRMLRIIKELKERFDQLHALARKYTRIIPCNLLNEEFECQINDFIDIDKEQFHVERKRNQVFMTVPAQQEKTGAGVARLIY